MLFVAFVHLCGMICEDREGKHGETQYITLLTSGASTIVEGIYCGKFSSSGVN